MARATLTLTLLCGALAGPVLAQDVASDLPPLGTPDWLSDAITRPHANVATDASVPAITVLPLDAVQLDATGLLPASITGLPEGLWGASETAVLADLMRRQPAQGLPAMLGFTETLALAELDPPRDAPPESAALFLARLDMLLSRGALEPAQAMMERAGPTDPAVFRRWFDVSLLTGHSDRACAAMNANPDIAPTFPARIFCLARGGDWSAAALSLGTGEALGQITEEEGDLIARFLDPELFEGEPPLPPDSTLTPLEFKMRMAIAERPDMTGLPLAFVYADLSVLAGWRAQLDAAERLTRSGAIEPQQWLAIYTAQAPSASGAVWDRVAALQAFDAALLAGDPVEASRRLGPAWQAMQEAGLEVAFADIYAERLMRTPLVGEAGILARRVGLLSPIYEQVAQSAIAQSTEEAFAFAIARGLPPDAATFDHSTDQAIAAAFAAEPPVHRYASYLSEDRLGEALLRASIVLARGAGSADADDLTDALVLFRSVGLEDVARRAALQLHLLRG
ncbi:hypothetical protein [Hasllibacter sp. MH4015]|uniref:hypothetical protein n=1 Tax=Hasllibacter sp. MH4015 TaxID=2854029 RepID=UPI001CD6613A